MKKIAGKIAMILVLVMLANTFTGCFTAWAVEVSKRGNEGDRALIGLLFLLCLGLDFVLWPIELMVYGGIRSVYAAEGGGPQTEEELALLTTKAASLPEADGAFLTAAITSLPETERASALERINSVPEQRFAAAVKAMRALYALPLSDRVLLAEAIHSLPETEQVFLTETADSLTDEEITALADEISSTPITEIVSRMKVLRETPSSDWGYREYAAERFVAR